MPGRAHTKLWCWGSHESPLLGVYGAVLGLRMLRHGAGELFMGPKIFVGGAPKGTPGSP